ncbi:hypothetical protein OBV_19640 [Oscillibacter valericigenes Sjm18-20]|nr:hypothetical protein OBV_19640 [Oscillibacter valericigenes Sjm18-20]
MTIKNDSVYNALIKTLLLILVLFLASTPVFYLMISSNAIGLNSVAYAYVYGTARVLRFIVAVVISCVIRKKNRKILAQNVLLRKKFSN